MSRLTEPDGHDPFAGGLPSLEGVSTDGRSPRVRLRMPTAADAPDILRVFGDAEAMRYWSHEPLPDLDAAQRYVDGIAGGWADRSLFQWAITQPPDDTLVGTVTLYEWDRRHRRVGIGFMLRRDLHGQGLAAEAARAALRFATDGMGVHRIEADADPDNAASRGLLTRLGFREEGYCRERWFTFGTWKDSVLYGLLAADMAA